jgi:dTDP-4-amino-4,6-dideoxygalactose transaminase
MDVIPFVDLKAQYRSIKHEIDPVVLNVLASGGYVLGAEVTRFEEEFAAAHGARYAVAMNSGTSALHVALLAAGVEPGDEVITVSMTFIATAAAVRYIGATPVFVDVDPVTVTMDSAQIEGKITPRTKVIVPVHLYGQPAEMQPIMDIADRHGIAVIEDAAQAHLAEYRGRRVGTFGRIGCFSFYPAKNLGAYGEGGLTVTDDVRLANAMRLLRDWGQATKYHHDVHAFNFRMDAVQGAILRVKLRHLEAWTDARRRHARRYDALLAGSGVRMVEAAADRRHVYHIYSVFHPQRDALQAALQQAGVQTGIHYPVPVHLQKAYADLGYSGGDLPVTERVASEQLSLPMFAELTDAQMDRVVETVRGFAAAPATRTA